MEDKTITTLIQMLDDINSKIENYEDSYIQKEDVFTQNYIGLTYLILINSRTKLQEVLVQVSSIYKKNVDKNLVM
tara:strand:+ start:979 stop:1203 length:225 start_codon:yes stop_codon:yes gene_type:complete